MDTLSSLFDAWLNNPNSQQMMFVILISGAIFIFALGMSYVVMGATNPIKKRLGVTLSDQDDNSEDPGRKLIDLPTIVGPIAQWLIPSSEIEINKTTKTLTYAGFRSPNALQTYYGIKAILFVALPAVVMFAARWMPELTNAQLGYALAAAAAVGLFGPNNVLGRLKDKRLKKLRDGFPDALDLLVVCVESGLGLSAAIQRVSEEISVSHEDLAMELMLVNAETRAGVDRSRALKNLADRTGLDDIRGLVSMLVQAMRFGTSIADTLRVYSEEFRDRRMQKAEEEAAKISTKMIFPLVFCLFPSFFLVAIGPAILRFIDVFRELSG
jgi:tight adherence protein C